MKHSVLYDVTFDGLRHASPGKTRHFRAGANVGSQIVKLEIRSYDGDPGFYLIYIDANGRDLNDTYHETPEDGFSQAEFEFGVRTAEWAKINDCEK